MKSKPPVGGQAYRQASRLLARKPVGTPNRITLLPSAAGIPQFKYRSQTAVLRLFVWPAGRLACQQEACVPEACVPTGGLLLIFSGRGRPHLPDRVRLLIQPLEHACYQRIVQAAR
jgi:hypothetical protein